MMNEGEERKQYGTFQGIPSPPSYPQQASSSHFGFPQPIPPPGVYIAPSAPPPPPYYTHGYQAVQGYAVVEGRPIIIREPRLPCCGIGIGWFLFVIGFFLAGVPWYAGTLILMCFRVDYREKPGFAACTIAAILAAIAVLLGVTKGTHSW